MLWSMPDDWGKWVVSNSPQETEFCQRPASLEEDSASGWKRSLDDTRFQPCEVLSRVPVQPCLHSEPKETPREEMCVV